MKKYLLGTTALAVAAVMAVPASAADAPSKISLGVGGFMEHAFGYAKNDNTGAGVGSTGYQKWGFESDVELYFRGNITLDNGLKFDTRLEYEANRDNENVAVDEVFVQISSPSLGLLELGSADYVTDSMSVAAPKVGWGLADVDDWLPNANVSDESDFMGGDPNASSTDSKKVSYYTPSNWQKSTGLQGAVSFSPNNSSTSNDAILKNSDGNGPGVAWGVVFNRKINDIGVYADYVGMHLTDDGLGESSGVTGHAFGLNLDFGPWLFGGSYTRYMDSKSSNAGISNSLDGWAYTAGVAYTMGKWQYGVSYGHIVTEGEVRVRGNDKYNALEVAAKYDLGKGISWRSSFMHSKQSEENNDDSVKTENSSGWAIVSGVVIGF
jgi:predicted porin